MTESDFSVKVEIEGGAPGVDRDPDNALSRALHVPMKEGNPQEATAPVYYSGSEEKPRFRWLGALVLTDGDRVLFFPSGTLEGDFSGSGFGEGDTIDHFTLEPDWQSWHLTSAPTTDPDKKDHPDSSPTLPIGSDGYLWFGLGVADEGLLPPVRETTIIRTGIPEKDVTDKERRGRVIREATDPYDGPVIQIPEASSSAGFPYFAFVVGPPGFDLSTELRLPVPDQPKVTNHLKSDPGSADIDLAQPIRLGDETEIHVFSLWLPGALKDHVSVTCGPPFLRVEAIEERGSNREK